MTEQRESAARHEMVRNQIEQRGVRDERVLEAMRTVPREAFVPVENRALAYRDGPLPIGWEQTISQPFVVAAMTELLGVFPGARVLEIGTGSGYQAAVLAELGAEVFSIEVVAPLAQRAATTLADLGYAVHVRHGDGYLGWPSEAPFDRIILTAAPPELPQVLVDQLAPGGRLVAPVGTLWQELDVVTKDANGAVETRQVMSVQFVPMVHGD